MHFFALVLIMCNVHSGRCDRYVPDVYDDAVSCESEATWLRKQRVEGAVAIYCTRTDKPGHTP